MKNEIKHTKTKWYYTDAPCKSNEFKLENNTYSVFINIHGEALKPTLTFGFTKEEAIANAKNIEKRVNMHDELIDAIKCVMEYHGKELNLLPVLKLSLEKILLEETNNNNK